jgi:parallel beta-helix repeat protein
MRQPKKTRLFLEQLEPRLALNSYFVSPTGSDNNAGTSAAPWLTLQHAADQLVAGDNVTVEPGTYAGFSMSWNFAQNGTAASPIVWHAQPGVIINAKNPNTADGIDLEGSSYVTINGFDVENPSGGTITRAGIRAVWNLTSNAQGVIIENNTANNCGTWGIFTSHEDGVLVQNNIAPRTLSSSTASTSAMPRSDRSSAATPVLAITAPAFT